MVLNLDASPGGENPVRCSYLLIVTIPARVETNREGEIHSQHLVWVVVIIDLLRLLKKMTLGQDREGEIQVQHSTLVAVVINLLNPFKVTIPGQVETSQGVEIRVQHLRWVAMIIDRLARTSADTGDLPVPKRRPARRMVQKTQNDLVVRARKDGQAVENGL